MCLSVVTVALFHRSFCLQVDAKECAQGTSVEPMSESQLAPGYYTYSSSEIEAARQRGDRVVLYFWAPWCSTCTSLDLDIKQKKTMVPPGVAVMRIDYDSARELKRQYNVVTQHTFVQIDSKGKELSSWVGGDFENFSKYLQ